MRPGGRSCCLQRWTGFYRPGGNTVQKIKILSPGVEVNWRHITFDFEHKNEWKNKTTTTTPAPKLNTPDRVNTQAAHEARKANQASHWGNLFGSTGVAGAPGCRLSVSHDSQGRISESEAGFPEDPRRRPPAVTQQKTTCTGRLLKAQPNHWIALF